MESLIVFLRTKSAAAIIANSLSEIDGVNALAQTQAQLTIPTGVVGTGQLTINAQIVEGADLASLTLAIDSLDGIQLLRMAVLSILRRSRVTILFSLLPVD